MSSPAPALLHVDPADNVLVALRSLPAGERIGEVTLKEAIAGGHKVARCAIQAGELIIKYGYPIGRASQAIAAGEHVHSHNVQSVLAGDLEALRFEEVAKSAPVQPTTEQETFDGYRRPDGSAATRNEIWIINTVGCINQTSEKIAHLARERFLKPGCGIDGIHAFVHPFGCSQLGDDLVHTQKVLAGLANHPNAGGVLILGLGCENNQMKDFLERVGPQPEGRIRFFNAQEVSDEVESGVEAIGHLARYAGQFKRQPIPVSELTLAMKCGGSDGFSGITANPLVGRVADVATKAGATVLLTEVPEMFGAERVLLERSRDAQIFRGLIGMVNEFRGYFRKHNEPIDENPSPGNKAGGITTLAEKSLGCVQKGGKAPIAQVLPYATRAQVGLGGLALLNAPGNDGVSGTALTIAGAHVLLFTTGRGNPMGFPVPTLKISSNSDLAARKPQWIDFNAGSLAEGTQSADVLTQALWRQILEVASGRLEAKNETRGQREIAIWKDGVTL